MAEIKDLGLPFAAKRLQAVLCELSGQLRAKTQSEPGLAGMGATVVLGLIRRNQALIAHMGDSRAYLLRQLRLKRVTKDHSITQLLVEKGDITPAQAATHPTRGRLTRFVGMDGEPLPKVQLLVIRPGDRLLLCTDGLTSMVNDGRLRSILASRAGIGVTCKHLVDAANAAGGQDNVTALLVEVVGTLIGSKR